MLQKYFLRIILFVVGVIGCTGCTGHIEQTGDMENTIVERRETTSWASDNVQKPANEENCIIGEKIQYIDGEPKNYLTDTQYVINSEIFDAELNKLLKMGDIDSLEN